MKLRLILYFTRRASRWLTNSALRSRRGGHAGLGIFQIDRGIRGVFLLPVGGQTEPQAVRASSHTGLAPGIFAFAFIQEDLHQDGMIVIGLRPKGPSLTAHLRREIEAVSCAAQGLLKKSARAQAASSTVTLTELEGFR